MNLFQELFRKVEPPMGDTFPPDRRGERFPATVARSRRLRLFVRGQSVASTGRHLLVGIATWSDYDMKLLDRIDDLPDNDLQIDVFDSDTFRSAEEIESLIPGINVWAQTPFVGYWVDGVLTEVAAGAWGRRLIAKVCGVDSDELDRFVLTRSRPA